MNLTESLLLPSFTHAHTDTSRKHSHIAVTDYLHSGSTSSLHVQAHKTRNFPIIIQSLFLNFSAATTWLQLPGAAEKSQAFGQDRPATYLSPLPMSIKILPFYPLQIHRSPHNYPPKLLLTIRSSSSNPNKTGCSLPFPLTRALESPLSLLSTSSNRSRLFF